jgi:hypothetical protein
VGEKKLESYGEGVLAVVGAETHAEAEGVTP